MEQDKLIIAGFGEILWDLFPAGKQLGGAPANFAYHCGVLGARAYPVSCIGNDEAGREILDLLLQKEISGEYLVVDQNHPTGTVSVQLDASGTPSYVIHEQVAWDFIPINEKLMALAPLLDAVCYGSLAQRSEISRETLRKFLDGLQPGCLKVFDINLRQHYFSREVIGETLLKSDILKLNDGELEVLSELFHLHGTEKEKLTTLMERYSLKLIALTKGEKGSMLITPEAFSFLEAEPVRIADTVGAGDAFTAAMTMGILKDLPLVTIHFQANRLAGFVCSQPGAMPEIGDELLKFFI